MLGHNNKLHHFGGKLRSFSSGLYAFGARQYAPWLAKFTSVDPLAAQSTDRTPYHYASNNPINRTDPTGMSDGQGDGKGGDKKASDGTAVDDRKGIDIVHGVETRQVDGKTQAKVLGHWADPKNVANKKAREAIKDHWSGEGADKAASAQEPQSTAPPEVPKVDFNSPQSDTPIEVPSEGTTAKKLDSTTVVKSASSNSGNNSGGSTNGSSGNQALSIAKDIVGAVDTANDIFKESTKYQTDKVDKQLKKWESDCKAKNGRVPDKKPPKLEGMLEAGKRFQNILKWTGVGLTVAAIILSFADAFAKGGNPEQLYDPIFDTIVTGFTLGMGFAGIAASIMYSSFKDSKYYFELKKFILSYF